MEVSGPANLLLAEMKYRIVVIFLSACTIQDAVLYPTVADFRWFATLSIADVIPFFVCFFPLSIFTGVGGKSGAPNFSLPYIPVGDGCQYGAL